MNSVNSDIELSLRDICANYNDKTIVKYNMKEYFEDLKFGKNLATKMLANSPISYSDLDVPVSIGTSSPAPIEITDWIDANLSPLYEWSGNVGRQATTIKLYTFSDSRTLEEITNMFHNVLSWLCICERISKSSCSKALSITIYLTPHLRKFPKKLDFLTPINVNGGFATVCAPRNEITVYRNEEWFKVFIHETIHAFGFEPAGIDEELFNSKINSLLGPVDHSIRAGETYCEVLARIWKTCFSAYSLSQERGYNSFNIAFWMLYMVELSFSQLQYRMLLNSQGIKCIDDVAGKWKETTHGIAYYVLTSLLLSFPESLFDWIRHSTRGALRYTGRREGIVEITNLIEVGIKKSECNKNQRRSTSGRMTAVPYLEYTRS